MNCERINFHYQAIIDVQGTIRAIDTKMGFLLLILLAPFQSIGLIHVHIAHLLTRVLHPTCIISSIVLALILLIFIFSWFLSFATALKAVLAINNPNTHIKNSDGCNNSFFLPNMFEKSLIDLFINRKGLESKKDIDTIVKEGPDDSPESLINTLVFEQAKLAYIRDIKMFRQKWAFHLAFAFLMSGVIAYLCSICIT